MSAVEDLNQERRITFCLYECWEKIAGKAGLPALKSMNRDEISPFKNNLVLIDLRNGHEDPTFQVIGSDLQEDLEEDLSNRSVSDVPRRTMLSRVTDHYLEVLANRVPIAFEAEFVNSDSEKALYRGILLPFSDDNHNINFILGGVRWILEKDVALDDSNPTIEELMRSISAGRDDTPTQHEEADIAAEHNTIDDVEEIDADLTMTEDGLHKSDPLTEDDFTSADVNEEVIDDNLEQTADNLVSDIENISEVGETLVDELNLEAESLVDEGERADLAYTEDSAVYDIEADLAKSETLLDELSLETEMLIDEDSGSDLELDAEEFANEELTGENIPLEDSSDINATDVSEEHAQAPDVIADDEEADDISDEATSVFGERSTETNKADDELYEAVPSAETSSITRKDFVPEADINEHDAINIEDEIFAIDVAENDNLFEDVADNADSISNEDDYNEIFDPEALPIAESEENATSIAEEALSLPEEPATSFVERLEKELYGHEELLEVTDKEDLEDQDADTSSFTNLEVPVNEENGEQAAPQTGVAADGIDLDSPETSEAFTKGPLSDETVDDYELEVLNSEKSLAEENEEVLGEQSLELSDYTELEEAVKEDSEDELTLEEQAAPQADMVADEISLDNSEETNIEFAEDASSEDLVDDYKIDAQNDENSLTTVDDGTLSENMFDGTEIGVNRSEESPEDKGIEDTQNTPEVDTEIADPVLSEEETDEILLVDEYLDVEDLRVEETNDEDHEPVTIDGFTSEQSISEPIEPAEDAQENIAPMAEEAEMPEAAPSANSDDDLSIEELMESIISERKFDLSHELEDSPEPEKVIEATDELEQEIESANEYISEDSLDGTEGALTEEALNEFTDDISLEDVSIESTPLEDTSSEDISLEDVSLDDTSSEDASLEEISLDDTSPEDAPLEDISLDDTPLEDASLEDMSLEETSSEDAPQEDSLADETAWEQPTVPEPIPVTLAELDIEAGGDEPQEIVDLDEVAQTTKPLEPKQKPKRTSVIERAMEMMSPNFSKPKDPIENISPEIGTVDIAEQDNTSDVSVAPVEMGETDFTSENLEVDEIEIDEIVTFDESELVEVEHDNEALGTATSLESVEIDEPDLISEEIEDDVIEVDEIVTFEDPEVAEMEITEEDPSPYVEHDVSEEFAVSLSTDETGQSLEELKATLKQIIGYIKKEDKNHNRSRDSLYNILTAIYEFHDTCEKSADAYNMLVNEYDLKIQSRAPFTPVLKICLGKDYDKTRLTEYAAALGIARYMNVDISEFHAFIKNFPGGIKGCVKEMRAIRKHGASGNITARKTRSIEEAREILRDMAPIASFRLKKIIVGNNVDEFCLLLAKRDGHDINVLKILDEKYIKLDPVIKRAAFIKGNLNDRK